MLTSALWTSLILVLPFCVFAGYSVLTYTNDSLTNWLRDKKVEIWYKDPVSVTEVVCLLVTVVNM